MMFLEYVIWGSWLPLLALYLGDVPEASPAARSGGSSRRRRSRRVVALFVGGQIADR